MKVSTESMPKELVSGNGETILLADDEEMILEMCADILEGLNYRVLKASNGIEALEIFESNMSNIDLAILDVVMPHLGGIEAGYLLRKTNPELKMLFVSGYDLSQTLTEHSTALNSTVLMKPYNIVEFSHEVLKVLRGR